ncbi:MAG: hypothetical protein A2293_11965 [Elusimicrobia bacterium RIFOXYB2_FULL_49_7]|nr:MAG: hypothetical protein A2293_11965 [Elusimicrobia bacterium RIFOXYB2_FULL_49_7]
MTYEFQCQACGRFFETEKRMTDNSNEPCPVCGKESLRVITGGAGFLAGGKSKTPCDTMGTCPGSCAMAGRCGAA